MKTDSETAKARSGSVQPDGSAHDRNTAIIREECERRIEVCRVNIYEAGFSVRYMNPRRSVEMLRQCVKYAEIAILDAEELTRRLNPPNSTVDQNQKAKDKP